MIQLTTQEEKLHARALNVRRQHRRCETELIEILQDVDRLKLYQKFGLTSTYAYAVSELGFTKDVAAIFISVARKAKKIPALQAAITQEKFTVSVAQKIVAAITVENAKELIEFAEHHSCREIERHVANVKPGAVYRDKAKCVAGNQVRIEIIVSQEEYEMFLRAQSLESQRTSRPATFRETFTTMMKMHLKRNDPIEKAKRAQKRRERTTHFVKADMSRDRQPSKRRRIPLTAAQTHALYEKTQGRCTYVDSRGNRCTSEKWLHAHHIKPVCQSGGNNIENLTHLCWHHHKMAHQHNLLK